MGIDFTDFDALVDERIDRWTDELAQLCRFPSEQGEREALEGAADWTAERLRALGADVEILTMPGAAPLVVGEIGQGPRTITMVQHYDVQPAVPLELWTAPPYEPEVRDGRLYARGATDNKGEFLPRLWAVEAWLDALGELPCHVRFLVEGEEEYGSEHLDAYLDSRPELRRADGALIEGGGLDMRGRPLITGGGRGIVVLELVCRTIAYDAHSSMAVLLPNAAVRLVQALATFWHADGTPAIEGLDTGLRPPTAQQLAVVDAAPLSILDDIRNEAGVTAFIGGREGREALRAMTFSPTLNIQGLWSGFIGPGDKTITPAEAHVRLDIRIVPDQIEADIVAAVRAHLDGHGFGDIELVSEQGERAWWTPTDHPLVQAAARASEDVAGQDADIVVAFSGTVPMYQVCAAHRVPATTLGSGRDDCHAHAPDENVRIEDLATAARITGRFLERFADAPEMPPVP